VLIIVTLTCCIAANASNSIVSFGDNGVGSTLTAHLPDVPGRCLE
jgi:hypothetical protein